MCANKRITGEKEEKRERAHLNERAKKMSLTFVEKTKALLPRMESKF